MNRGLIKWAHNLCTKPVYRVIQRPVFFPRTSLGIILIVLYVLITSPITPIYGSLSSDIPRYWRPGGELAVNFSGSNSQPIDPKSDAHRILPAIFLL